MDIQKKMGDLADMEPISATYDLESKAVISLMTEVADNADIVGQMADGTTMYILHLSAEAADTLAALFSDSEDEHDGREPEEEV